MKILLLGKGGQLGWELQRALAPLGQLHAFDFDTPGPSQAPHLRADFSQPDQVAELVDVLEPDVIVNAAAHTAVDKAESEPDLARLINATTPSRLAKVAQRSKALLVHYSTDYVFDGSGQSARTELDAAGPLSVYGQTKLEAEQAIAASGCRHLIFRTSWVYAARGGNFAKTMLKLAAERDQLKVIHDQVGAPTGADLLADVTAHAMRLVQRDAALSGLYHLVASGETSWFDYARFVVAKARERGRVFKVNEDAIQSTATADYPTPARRPLNSRLDTRKLCNAFDLTLPHWQVGVERMLAEVLGD